MNKDPLIEQYNKTIPKFAVLMSLYMFVMAVVNIEAGKHIMVALNLFGFVVRMNLIFPIKK